MRQRAYSAICMLVLVGLVFAACGCGMAGLGETSNEARIRRARVMELSGDQLVEDIDAVLLLDRPSRLSAERVR